MNWYKNANGINSHSYTRAGGIVDGREVLDYIPNTDSISASLENYEEVPGIQELPMSAFGLTGQSYSVSENKRISKLTELIRQSNKIAPLIVVEDAEGLYILEGSHRADALYRLKAKSIPALIIRDLDSLAKNQQAPNQNFINRGEDELVL